VFPLTISGQGCDVMEFGVEFNVAVSTNQQAPIELALNHCPRPGVAFRSDPKGLAILMMKGQRIETTIIPTQTALAAFVLHGQALEFSSSPGNEVLAFAPRGTKATLAAAECLATPRPCTTPSHSRLLYH
jgi:hypothetical protein